MSTLTIPRTRQATILGIVGFAVALAAASQIAIPLPGTPVPLTLQPMLVILAGLMLGPSAALASTVLFLLAGVAGLPVFTPGGAPGVARLVGPTGGYLIAYPVAALVTGWLALRATSYATRALAAGAGMLVVYLGGLAQLALLTGSLERAAIVGILPFAAADAVKALVAAAIAGPRTRR